MWLLLKKPRRLCGANRREAIWWWGRRGLGDCRYHDHVNDLF
jgi:hypothetical protein